MQEYRVLKDMEVQDDTSPLAGTHSAGAVVSTDAEPEHPSILAALEEGFIELVEKLEGKEESSDSDDEAPAPENVSDENQAAKKPAPVQTTSNVATPAAKVKPTVPTPAEVATSELASKFPTPPAPFQSMAPMLYAFCKQIEAHEVCEAPGQDPKYPQGTRSYFNKNPGNLKFRNQAGAIAEDKDGFAIFDTADDGFLALADQVTIVANGTSAAYKNPLWDANEKAWRQMNFLDFFKIYDSSYGDDPVAYATDVAAGMEVPATTTIKQLLG